MTSKSKYSVKLNRIVAGAYSLSCQCNNVEVELFITKRKSPTTELDRIYFNRVKDKGGKWSHFFGELSRQQRVSFMFVF